MECGVVAVGAASTTAAAVPVGARESCVEHDFLKPLAVCLPEISDKRTVSFSVWKLVGVIHARKVNRNLQYFEVARKVLIVSKMLLMPAYKGEQA